MVGIIFLSGRLTNQKTTQHIKLAKRISKKKKKTFRTAPPISRFFRPYESPTVRDSRDPSSRGLKYENFKENF